MLTVPRQSLFTPLQWVFVALVLAIGAVAMPLAHALLPPESPFWPDTYAVTLVGKFLCYAIVALARQLALQAQLVAREGDQWTLRVESNSLNQAGARERLRAALETAGHARQLQIEQGAVTDSPARRLAVETYLRQGIAEDIVNSNALVQTLKRDFGAKIVPGSIKPISIQPE